MPQSSNQKTYVISDIHLSEEENNPANPYWRTYKRGENSPDKNIISFIDHISKGNDSPVELIFNGDTFDFDSVTALPSKHESADKKIKISYLEKIRGLNSEKTKSEFKIRRIIKDHEMVFDRLKTFVSSGNKLIFIIGNHDVELFWPSVQKIIKDRIVALDEDRERIVFCNWFYVSNKDTLIEHGNQYDPYCVCIDPINPYIFSMGKAKVRLAFSDNACKFILNGIGSINPHSHDSFSNSTSGWIKFFFKYAIKYEPMILFNHFMGALLTFIVSIHEAMITSTNKTTTTLSKLDKIAKDSKCGIRSLIFLRELHAKSISYSPLSAAKVLRLDLIIAFLIFFVGLIDDIFFNSSYCTIIITSLLLLPVMGLFFSLVMYGHGKSPTIKEASDEIESIAATSAKILDVRNVIFGHTHQEFSKVIENVTVINTGTWSFSFSDLECKVRFGRSCFALIENDLESKKRKANLFLWDPENGVKELGVEKKDIISRTEQEEALSEIISLIFNSKLKEIEEKLKSTKVNLNFVDSKGKSPLVYAIESNNSKIVLSLLLAGADVFFVHEELHESCLDKIIQSGLLSDIELSKYLDSTLNKGAKSHNFEP